MFGVLCGRLESLSTGDGLILTFRCREVTNFFVRTGIPHLSVFEPKSIHPVAVGIDGGTLAGDVAGAELKTVTALEAEQPVVGDSLDRLGLDLHAKRGTQPPRRKGFIHRFRPQTLLPTCSRSP